MGNPLKGEAPLKALGQTWTLKLPFTEGRRLKAEHGIDLINDRSALADLEKFDLVLAAMLRTKHPDAPDETAGEILNDLGIKPVLDAMQPALAAFLGVPVEDLKKAKAPSQ